MHDNVLWLVSNGYMHADVVRLVSAEWNMHDDVLQLVSAGWNVHDDVLQLLKVLALDGTHRIMFFS